MIFHTLILVSMTFAPSVVALPQSGPAVQNSSPKKVAVDTAPAGNAIAIADYWKTATANLPEVTKPPVDEIEAAKRMTISIYNRMGRDIRTKHSLNAGFPDIVSGSKGEGVMASGADSSFVVPEGWAGNLAVVQNGGGRAFVGDESLIEGSFVNQGAPGVLFDIDVSYVTGFSLPITCTCDDHTVTGCNKDLWVSHTCPNDNGKGSCKNPHRDGPQSATDFFKPCQHAAYTYPEDHAANANNKCQGTKVSCCVGPTCRPNPNQS